MKRYWMWPVAALVLALLVARVKFSPVPAEAHTICLGDLVAEVMGTGTLEARVKTTISPRIQERLVEVLVDQNDSVQQGQLLARLENRELLRQVEVASATLEAAKATVERVRIDEARAAAVEQQARQDHTRITDLVKTKISSQSELDKAIEHLRVAESDLRRAQAATVEARHQVTMAQKNLEYHQERLEFTQVRSPYDGLVIRRDRDPGGVVVPGSSLLQLISTNELWISAWVDETAMSAVAVGQMAQVVFRSEPDKRFPGEVSRLGRETDRETREFIVDVRVKELPANWTIGQRAEVFIETGRKTSALAVPQRFVHWRESKPGVFVVQNGSARWRDVALGLRGRGMVEIAKGIAADVQVVAPKQPGQRPLAEGTRVKAQLAEAESKRK